MLEGYRENGGRYHNDDCLWLHNHDCPACGFINDSVYKPDLLTADIVVRCKRTFRGLEESRCSGSWRVTMDEKAKSALRKRIALIEARENAWFEYEKARDLVAAENRKAAKSGVK